MSWLNHDDVLRQMRDAGLVVDVLEVGRMVRCRTDDHREKRGWYLLREVRAYTGEGFLLVGSFGIWRGNEPNRCNVELARGAPLSDAQREAMRASQKADFKAAQQAERAVNERAARRAAAMWTRLRSDGESEYLRAKCVQGHGVRYSEVGTVVVPLLDAAGAIHGLHAIYPKGHPKIARLKRNKDYWPAGLAKKAHFFLIGSPAVGAACLVAEGYATAASAFEATGLPVAVAFDANNLLPVAQALRKRYHGLRLLFLADDDYIGRCEACHKYTPVATPACAHCGQPHQRVNTGVLASESAALAVDGKVVIPRFATARPLDAKGPSDFNDLHVADGLQAVRTQIEGCLTALKWTGRPQAALTHPSQGEGEAAGGDLRNLTALQELLDRFALVYEAADVVFDGQEHKLVPLSSMRNICVSRQLHRFWMESHDKRLVRLEEVGFDPTGRDEVVKCNLWGGWPTRARAGRCEKLLELGEYLCSESTKAGDVWRWLLAWMAFPIQNPGAKMKTAVIMHGPQGTGKSLLFESVLAIYGPYGRMLNQDAVEDKFNDWASRLLFAVADEMVERGEVYHAKNKLKGLITGDRIRINPKNLAPYYERNHANIAFLSNETIPAALERDDRRHGVIWTPKKLAEDFYNTVLREIADGAVPALHHYLLRLNIAGFGPATLPPLTEAKIDLIELGMESAERFLLAWIGRDMPLPPVATRSEDLYQAYRHWCGIQGVVRPAQLSTFIGNIAKREGVRKSRERHFLNYSQTREVQSTIIRPPGAPETDGKKALAEQINQFAEALRDWKGENQTSERFKGPGERRVAANGDSDAAY